MKKPGNVCDHTESRNVEIVNCFRSFLSQRQCISTKEIFRRVAMAPASRFFVSEDRAFLVISEKKRFGYWSVASKLRLSMFKEIEKMADEFLLNGEAMSLEEAVYMAVNSPAPSFYLTPGSCRTIIYTNIHAC